MINDWKQFEQLVAAIHKATSQGASVRWNETIEGRQFDVTLRFKEGVHDYLTVVECKHQKEFVSVGEVDAFVTKSRDVKANKAVLVTSSDFQSGCATVAERHGVTLMTVAEEFDQPPLPPDAKLLDTLIVDDVTVHFADGQVVALGTTPKLEYATRNSWIQLGSGMRASIDRVLDDSQQHLLRVATSQKVARIPLPPGTTFISIVDRDVTIADATAVSCTVEVKKLYHSASAPPVDMHLMQGLSTKYVLRLQTGAPVYEGFLRDLSLGAWDDIEAGHFYILPALGFHYYCEDIDGDLITWILVESYQMGLLVQSRMKQRASYAQQYVRVRDRQRIKALRRLYNRMLSREGPHDQGA